MRNVLFGLLLVLAFESGLEAQTPFYRGKTMTLVVGTKI